MMMSPNTSRSSTRHRRSNLLTIEFNNDIDNRYIDTQPPPGDTAEPIHENQSTYFLKYLIILISTSLFSAFIAFWAGNYLSDTLNNCVMDDLPRLLTHVTDASRRTLYSLNGVQNYQDYETIARALRNLQKATLYFSKKQEITEKRSRSLERLIHTLHQDIQKTARESKQIQKHTKTIVEEALAVYDADKLGLEDFALESGGGKIISLRDARPYEKGAYYFLGIFKFKTESDIDQMIRPETNPGQCFCFYGNRATIRIRLSHQVFISAVTIDHTPASLVSSTKLSSAPREVLVKGINADSKEFGKVIGAFVYQIQGTPRQTFILYDTKQENVAYKYVDLEIISNHGHPEFTCIYRFRVHGKICEFCDNNKE